VKISLVLSTHAAQFQAVALKGNLAENVARIASWGYRGVELAIRDPALVDAGELEALVRAHGLAVPAIGTGQAWGEEGLSYSDVDPAIRRAAIERTRAHVPVAGRLNALIIIGLLRGVVRQGVDAEQAHGWMVAALRECCDAAGRLGVRLALEPLNRYETTLINTAAEGLALIEEVGAPNLGLLLDTFHMNIEEDSFAGAIRQAGSRLGHFHIGETNRKPPGQGRMPWPEIATALKEIDYRGPIVMEPFVKMGGQVGQDIRVWRDLSEGAAESELDEAIRQSVAFCRKTFA